MGNYWYNPLSAVEVEQDSTEDAKDKIVPHHDGCMLHTEDVGKYCKQLVGCKFYGQTNATSEDTDTAYTTKVLNLGLYLELLDQVLRSYEPMEFHEDEEQFTRLLNLIACKRHTDKEKIEHCYERLLKDLKRFIPIYRKRNVKSEECSHKEFWGTRQQLLSGKVIADYLEPEQGSLDPIYGVLLNPTAGRVGPGDSGWFHNLLYDDTGFMAYHSAVHDAFGYLITNHDIGPGYDYIGDSYLDDENFMAGQTSGIMFWRKVLDDIETKLEVINAFTA